MKLLLSLLFTIILLTLPGSALAQDGEEFNPLVDDIPGITDVEGEVTFASYMEGLFVILISIATVAAVLMLVIGGVQYMASDAISSKQAAKEKFKGSVFGLLIVLAAWVILYTINPSITGFGGLGGQELPDAEEFAWCFVKKDESLKGGERAVCDRTRASCLALLAKHNEIYDDVFCVPAKDWKDASEKTNN